jgi:glycosyltransferase involved in cell wall biosynthesis
MRVVHLSTRDDGAGAFRGARWLHDALRSHGVDSQMLVARRFSTDPTIHLTGPRWLAHAQHVVRRRLDKRALPTAPGKLFSPARRSANLQPTLRRLHPDLLHLHWIADGFIRPEDFVGWGLPLVWTLRDQWAMTGGCHIPTPCRRYEAMCGACPQLGSADEHDLSRQVWQRKRAAWEGCDLTVVGLSRWIAGCAAQSSLLGRFPITVIPNAIDTVRFAPTPKAAARAALGLPAEGQIILFGAHDAVQNRQKGYHLLVDALRQLTQAAQTGAVPPYHLVVFGAEAASGEEALPLPMTFLGKINDDARLALLYSAADLFAIPSLVESFGKTGAEALACGTPVVAFEETGLADVVAHAECGYLAPYGDSRGIAAGIRYVLEDAERLAQLSTHARARALQHFAFANVAAQYEALYASILERRRMAHR